MITVFADCHLMGPDFSPGQAEAATGLRFLEKSEPGEVYRHGDALLKLDDPEPGSDFYDLASPLISALKLHLEALRAAGAEDIRLNFHVEHDGQCNLAFSPQWMTAIAELGLTVNVTTYES